MTQKPRVLLLSASSGAGHVRAAQALEKAYIARGDCHVEHIDAIDYVVHAMWLCRTVGRYYVALQEAAEYLARIGVPREIVGVSGIPVDPLFAVPLDRAAARSALNLDAKSPILLLAAGGYGIGPLEQLVRDLLALQKPWQLGAIPGNSEKMKKRLDEIATCAGTSGSPRLVPVGFTTQMDQYMAAADLLVGKAGGLTTSEALAR